VAEHRQREEDRGREDQCAPDDAIPGWRIDLASRTPGLSLASFLADAPRPSRGSLLELIGVDLDLLALLVDVDVLVLVAAFLLPPAALLA